MGRPALLIYFLWALRKVERSPESEKDKEAFIQWQSTEAALGGTAGAGVGIGLGIGMAIGQPLIGLFLGLLGTVWGVMNTFAAMAEAGEANIMAIAPGVASALSTTVVGLIVAIPALFGYNYLVGKIKSITAEMMIIVDQLSVNIEEIYGASK